MAICRGRGKTWESNYPLSMARLNNEFDACKQLTIRKQSYVLKYKGGVFFCINNKLLLLLIFLTWWPTQMPKVVAFVASPDRPSKTCSICREAIDWIADAHVVFLPCKKTIPLLEWEHYYLCWTPLNGPSCRQPSRTMWPPPLLPVWKDLA